MGDMYDIGIVKFQLNLHTINIWKNKTPLPPESNGNDELRRGELRRGELRRGNLYYCYQRGS